MSRSRSRSHSRESPRAAREASRSRSRSPRRDEDNDRRRDDSRPTDDNRRRRTDDKGESNSILVRNLNYRTPPEELKKVFSEFGEVTDVYLPLDYYSKRPRGFGFIQFTNAGDAQAACKAVDGTDVDGNKVEVVIAKQNRKSPTTMRKFGSKRDDKYSSRREDNYSDRRGYRESREYSRRSRSRSYDDRRRGEGRRDYDRKDSRY